MPNTTFSGLSQRTTAWAVKNMLDHARPVEVLAQYGMTQPVPKNTSDTIKFRRPIPLPLDTITTPLTEGVSPSKRAMQYEDVTAQLKQYGDVVGITDRVQDIAEDPVLKDATELCGEQAAEYKELLLWGAICGGSNVYYANGTARSVVNTKLTTTLQRAVVRHLKNERARKVTSKVSSTVKYGTEQIAPAFLAFAHTDCEADIREMAGFVPCEKYGSMEALPHEIGKVEDVRYICSPVLNPFVGEGSTTANGMVQSDGTNVDVYPVVYIGKDAFGHVALRGSKAFSPMIVNPGTASDSDPLGQRGSVGWKTYFDALILNQAWLCRVEVGITDLA